MRPARRRTHQECGQIIELARREPLAVVGGHDRMIEKAQLSQFGFLKEVESAVFAQKLHREIVFAANQAFYAFPRLGDGYGCFIAILRNTSRIHNRFDYGFRGH